MSPSYKNLGLRRWHLRVAILAFLICFMNALPMQASDLASKLEHLIGYTILFSKTIEGWYEDNEVKEGSFEGCRYGRVIVFTDRTRLTCVEYGYTYSYRPTAIILGKQFEVNGRSFTDFKMIVEGEVFDMTR